MPLWANWNGLHLPSFKGTPLEELFPGYIEPFVAAMQASLAGVKSNTDYVARA
jgi:hypothetical protein